MYIVYSAKVMYCKVRGDFGESCYDFEFDECAVKHILPCNVYITFRLSTT